MDGLVEKEALLSASLEELLKDKLQQKKEIVRRYALYVSELLLIESQYGLVHATAHCLIPRNYEQIIVTLPGCLFLD